MKTGPGLTAAASRARAFSPAPGLNPISINSEIEPGNFGQFSLGSVSPSLSPSTFLIAGAAAVSLHALWHVYTAAPEINHWLKN